MSGSQKYDKHFNAHLAFKKKKKKKKVQHNTLRTVLICRLEQILLHCCLLQSWSQKTGSLAAKLDAQGNSMSDPVQRVNPQINTQVQTLSNISFIYMLC